jgi:hypothetical protein
VSLICCGLAEQEKARPDTAAACGGEREHPERPEPRRGRVPMRGALADRLVVVVRLL